MEQVKTKSVEPQQRFSLTETNWDEVIPLLRRNLPACVPGTVTANIPADQIQLREKDDASKNS